jgi:hypothetical protein
MQLRLQRAHPQRQLAYRLSQVFFFIMESSRARRLSMRRKAGR